MDLKTLAALAIIVLVAGVSLVLGGVINDEIYDTMRDRDSAQSSSTDEVTLSDGTYVALTHDDIISVSSVSNATGTTLTSGNYTIENNAGQIRLDDATYDGLDFNVSYSWYINTHSTNASEQVGSSLGTMASFLPIVALVVIAVVIIALISRVGGGSKI